MQVWQEVLQQQQGNPIGVTTDFYSIGGTSLMAIMAAVRLKDMFDLGAKGEALIPVLLLAAL